MRFEESDSEKISRSIAEIESKTSAELIVVVKPWSGSYRDLSCFAGFFLSMAFLCVNLFSPWEVSLLFILLESLAGFFVGFFLFSFLRLSRFVAGKKRLELQVQAAAREFFVSRGIYTTTSRTGILIYVSALEKIVYVLADVGVVQAIPSSEWSTWQARLWRIVHERKQTADVLIAHLQELSLILERYIPPTVGKMNELSDDVDVGRGVK